MSVQALLLGMLEAVAEALGCDLRSRLVFVGGCTTALHITDPITLADVRATDDIDLIVDLAGEASWYQLLEELRQKGFKESLDDDVICRMRLDVLKVDFMPDDEKILGFTNRWYAMGIETAATKTLPSGLSIKCLTPPLFIATKLEAYLGRGENDPLGSHDLEDILVVTDGREELVGEVLGADESLRRYIAEQITLLKNHRDFDGLVNGNVRGPEGRADIVRERLSAMTADTG